MSTISSDHSPISEKIQQLQDKLLNKERALQNKTEELDRFSHVIAHDLKAPLSQIKLIVHLLKKKLPPEKLNKEAIQLLEMLFLSITQMSTLIDTIHGYAKSGIFDYSTTTFSLEELLEEIKSNIIAPSQGVKLHFHEKEQSVTANRPQLLQVLSQLIHNAVQYHHSAEGNVVLRFHELEDAYVFEVIDDGPGIPVEYRESIFQIFNKGVKRANGSAGVGLSIANKLVENAGGTLSVESKVGKGSTFKFTWPKIKAKNS